MCIRHSTLGIRLSTFDLRLSTFRIRHSLVPILLIAFSLTMAFRSSGFLELDELTHFMYARESWSDWRRLVDIWGRPLCTGLYALAAPFGIRIARGLAVFISVITAAGTVQLGRIFLPDLPRAGRLYPSILWLLLFAQPMFLLHSFAVMTEMLLACLWVWAAVAFLHRRPLLAGMLIGLGGLARPEGWVAVACWPMLLWAVGGGRWAVGSERWAVGSGKWEVSGGQRFASVAAALLPMIGWWIAGRFAYGSWDWWIRRWPWAEQSPYGATPVRFFLGFFLALAFWMIVPLLAGVRRIWRRHVFGAERRYPALLLFIPLAGLIGLHGFLSLFGLFGSLGLPRYFVSVAPFIALLCWFGVEQWMEGAETDRAGRSRRNPQSLDGPRTIRPYGLSILCLSLTPALLLLVAGQLPIPRNVQFRRLDEAIAWITDIRRSSESQPPTFLSNGSSAVWDIDSTPAHIVAAHPYVYYRLGLPLSSPGHLMAFSRVALGSAAIGTVVIVENVIWEYDGFTPVAQLQQWGYELVRSFRPDAGTGEPISLLATTFPSVAHLLTLVADQARVDVWVKQR